MCALLIRDGEPYWWNSPDIWTVPGDDPDGPPGPPQVGQPTFVWSRVHNKGRSVLDNAQVRFYWSNPATGVLRSNSTAIGTSFATIQPGMSVDVLCVTPWLPVGVNGGHVCLVAEAVHPASPLPDPLPDAFSPPLYDQVAQRNIDLLPMAAGMMRAIAIQIATPARQARRSVLTVERRGRGLDAALARSLGLGRRRFVADLPIEAGLQDGPGIDCGRFDPVTKVRRDLKPGAVEAVHLVVRAGEIAQRAYGLLDVVEREAETGAVLGGVTFVILAREG